MKNNPFKKRTLAYNFYRIDKFLNSKKMLKTKEISSDIISISSIFLLPLQIVFLIIKFILEILYIATIGIIVAMFIS